MAARGPLFRQTPLKVFAAAVLTVAVGAAVLAISIYGELERAVSTPHENIQWAAYQLQAEHLRLLLAAQGAAAGSVELEELDQRYQIFVSRVLILRDGDAYAPMHRIAGFGAMLANAVEAVPRIDAEIERIGGDARAYAAILARHLGDLAGPMQQVALQAVGAASTEQSQRQLSLLDTVSYLAVTLVLIVTASIALAAVTVRQFAALESGRRELAAALDRAEKSSRAKSRFLAGMSHEMRTPLNAVIGMLREIGHQSGDAMVRRLAATAHVSADMLCGLVDDVLDTTRIETGKFQFHHAAFDPAALIDEVILVLAGRAEDRGNRVAVHVDLPASRWLVSDRGRLKQVLVNLVGNAVKYTRDGLVTVTASTVPGPDGATLLRVDVADTGIGITAPHLDIVFNRFFQAGSNDGLGLGLSISREIVERLGGRIGVDSVLKQGSTFWFEVPVSLTARPEIAGVRRGLSGRLAGLRLLVAEDNSTNRQVIRLLLERQGAALEFAVDGEQAVAMALADPYDLVLMDINMPDMDGLQALSEIRRLAGPAAPPVIALTADALPEDTARFQAAGMADCVTKPIDEAALVLAIASVLGRPDLVASPAAMAVDRPAAPSSLTASQRQAVLDLIAGIGDEQEAAA